MPEKKLYDDMVAFGSKGLAGILRIGSRALWAVGLEGARFDLIQQHSEIWGSTILTTERMSIT